MKEIWKAVEGYKGYYSVSNTGRVRRDKARCGVPRILKHANNSDGYPQCVLHKDNKAKSAKIHTLVAHAFTGKRPVGYVVNHIDGIKTNNVPRNLEYITARENTAHAVRLRLFAHSEKNGQSKLKEVEVIAIRERYNAGGVSHRLLGVEYGVAHRTIFDIIHRHNWRYVR